MLTRTKFTMDSTFKDDLDADSLECIPDCYSYRG